MPSRHTRHHFLAAGLWTAVALTVTGLCLVVSSRDVLAYVFMFDDGPKWPNGNVVMHLQLGRPSGQLTDGSATWGQSAEGALEAWNSFMRDVRLQPERDSSIPWSDDDGRNSVFFNGTVFGRPFDSATLAVTQLWREPGGALTEADVVFNTAIAWDSYRGSLQPRVSDFRRVAIHEFGHVLGLGHPDEAGQRRDAIMNHEVSNIELPTSDDVEGAVALYGAMPPPRASNGNVEFPPRNESFQFRNDLETKYRTGLQRGPSYSAVDIEGSVIWTQEYLRYRVNGCSHLDAVTRVFLQIDSRGIQPVCRAFDSTQVLFPPRNEAMDFRMALEAKYRDGLRRPQDRTYVDAEGDLVWTQEYLRYRVNRCGHQQAVQRVFNQIDGRGIAPPC